MCKFNSHPIDNHIVEVGLKVPESRAQRLQAWVIVEVEAGALKVAREPCVGQRLS